MRWDMLDFAKIFLKNYIQGCLKSLWEMVLHGKYFGAKNSKSMHRKDIKKLIDNKYEQNYS